MPVVRYKRDTSKSFHSFIRACRLKKKAGHEANKIKFYGLNQENSRFSFSVSI